MAIHIRNFKTPTLVATWSAHATTILMREFLKLAGWTDQSITTGPIGPSADAAWASCLIINDTGFPTGFSVSSLIPNVINDPTGRFTLAMETGNYSIFLNGTSNKGAFRIVEFIDVNNVRIEPANAPPTGWVTEANIPARVINANAARLAAAATFLSQAPTGNLQARVAHVTTSSCMCYARPKGGVPLATEVPSAGLQMANGTDTFLRFNAVLDGKNCLVSLLSSASAFRSVQWGELTNVDTGDTNPGFVWLISAPANHVTTLPLYMLNFSDAQITAYPTFPKWFTATGQADCYYLKEMRRLMDGRPGRLHLRAPKVVLDNISANACVRGKLPIIRVCNYYLESWRPIDALGAWLHLTAGLVVPRNGSSDPLPIVGG